MAYQVQCTDKVRVYYNECCFYYYLCMMLIDGMGVTSE